MFNYEYLTELYPQGLIVDGPASPNHDYMELFYDAAVPSFAHNDWDPWLSTAPPDAEPHFIDLTAEMHYTEATYFDEFVLPDALGSIELIPGPYQNGIITITFQRYSAPTARYKIVVSASITAWTMVKHIIVDLTIALINTTAEINPPSDILQSLVAKLDSAVEVLDDVNENNDLSAVNKLQAFINAVEAQRGNQISEDDADSLRAAAQEIIDMLNGQ
jgi:hypothetical protein